MPGIPQNGRLHLFFYARKSPKWAAKPPIFCFSWHEIKGVADHFGGFRAWIPERSDFFKGSKGPKGPLGPERSDFFKGTFFFFCLLGALGPGAKRVNSERGVPGGRPPPGFNLFLNNIDPGCIWLKILGSRFQQAGIRI